MASTVQPCSAAAKKSAVAAWPTSSSEYRNARTPYFQLSRQKIVVMATKKYEVDSSDMAISVEIG